MALRRFSFSIERDRAEDRMVDLMIAAEALFLHDIGGERTELGYRLALRAAKFVESATYGPNDLLKLFREAYGARSTIVHGSTPTSLRLPNQGHVPLDEFVTVFEREIRSAIRKSIEMSGRRSFEVRWDDLILGANVV
jgi:hypothetical protein